VTQYIVNAALGGYLRTKEDELRRRIGLDKIPRTHGRKLARAEIVFAVSKNCAEERYAFRLLRMLTSSDIGAALMQDGRLSAVSLPETASGDCPIMNQAAQVFAQATGVQTDYGDYLSPQMHELHRRAAHRVMWGEISPVEGAQQMEALASHIAKRGP